MAPFLAIKSVRKVYGGNLIINYGYYRYPFTPHYQIFGLGLEHVELADYIFWSSDFSDFIKPMSHLKNLSILPQAIISITSI